MPDDEDLLEAQRSLFLDPRDPEVAEQARFDGIPDDWIEAAKRSPVYPLAMEWKIALPLHPQNPGRCRWSGTFRRSRRRWASSKARAPKPTPTMFSRP